MFVFSMQLMEYLRLCKPPVVHIGKDALASKRLVERCKTTLKSVYYPCPYVWNRHLVLLPFMMKGFWTKVIWPTVKWERELITLQDGEKIALDWAISDKDECCSEGTKESDDDTPIVMIHHGAYCNSKDFPGQDYVHTAHKRGWIVCALNRRGHGGRNTRMTKARWNFFGSTSDVAYIAKEVILKRRPRARLLMVGFSAGSALTAKFFGEYRDLFTAGVGVCPGYDITRCMARFARVYHDVLLYLGKRFYLKKNMELLRDVKGYDNCMAATNLQEWLSAAHAMAGYKSPEDYYANCNPMVSVDEIKNPCLFINAEDDPLCVIENFYENKTFIDKSKHCIVAVTKTGSHLPFFEGFLMENWADRATYEFFDAALEEVASKNNNDNNNEEEEEEEEEGDNANYVIVTDDKMAMHC